MEFSIIDPQNIARVVKMLEQESAVVEIVKKMRLDSKLPYGKDALLANSNQSEAEKYYRLLHVLDCI